MRFFLRSLSFLLLCSVMFTSFPIDASDADLTTKYRVYQNAKLVGEYADKHAAIQRAKWLTNSYVEQVATREWEYHNFPRYVVYQKDTLLPKRFHTLTEAIQEARKWSYSSVRDVEQPGWVWDRFPREMKYQLFQGETSLEHWQFSQLAVAKREASKWSNAHIIDRSSNRWVWDNLSEAEKERRREGDPIYQIEAENPAIDGHTFAYLEDAFTLARQVENVTITNYSTGKQVYTNDFPYEVQQNRKPLKKFSRLHDAIVYAKQWTNGTINMDGREIWSSYNFYRVYDEQGNIRTSHGSITAAIEDALNRTRGSIRDIHGSLIWENKSQLQYWGWTGSASDERIKEWVERTVGLDVVSPTWFKLISVDGQLEDTSSQPLVEWLQQQGLEVHPLIHNQFSAELTSAFFDDERAQQRFIQEIIDKSSALGVDGINLDFESMAGTDRDRYTAFVRQFSSAAKEQGLTFSIDIPRGDMRWNHLSAFDREQLAKHVDYVIIMAYDQHWTGSVTPGSVAGFEWTKEGVQNFLSYGIPRDKLMMGIPFYIREWKLDASGKLVSNTALYTIDVDERLAGKAYTSTWDPEYEQYRIEFEEDEHTIVFWLEDAETVQRRLDIAHEERLAGVSAWRLGQESLDIWSALAERKNK